MIIGDVEFTFKVLNNKLEWKWESFVYSGSECLVYFYKNVPDPLNPLKTVETYKDIMSYQLIQYKNDPRFFKRRFEREYRRSRAALRFANNYKVIRDEFWEDVAKVFVRAGRKHLVC